MSLKAGIFSVVIISMTIFLITCRDHKKASIPARQSPYLNHGDSARYVGNEVCGRCHGDKLEGFMHTGMGLSFAAASLQKSAASFRHEPFYDPALDFYYKPFWKGDSLMLMEYRLDRTDTIHKHVQAIHYIIGSGHHTNSHLFMSGKHLFQAPATWYVQKKQWDLPPGFEMGGSSRFSRKIGNECMTCHNDYPVHDEASINRFTAVPSGISCERCHGPGSIHVQRKMRGELVDTATQIDYSIVNPGKLSIDLQFDLCQRCHLQGNAVLADGKSFYDFLPGTKLSDVTTIFLPRYEGDKEHFIMASHADRIKQSACFIESNKKLAANDLRPYRKGFTCVTCHNPHQSVRDLGDAWFNTKCGNCHKAGSAVCSEKQDVRMASGDNCVKCHMPVSGSIDIPHVTIHDHYIRKPTRTRSQAAEKRFAGLHPVNQPNPPQITWIRAYLNQYEKFDKAPHHLDSAFARISKIRDRGAVFKEVIRYHFLKQDFRALLASVNEVGQETVLSAGFLKKDAEHEGAWTAYRIGEAFNETGDVKNALRFFEASIRLAGKIPEFQNKVAACYYQTGNVGKAKMIYADLHANHPYFALAKSNYAFLLLQEGQIEEAIRLSSQALELEPDNESVVFNRIQVLVSTKRMGEAKKLLGYFLKKNPNHVRAGELMQMF